MVDIPVNSQNKPVEYLTRKFAINYNLPTLGKLVDPARRFPTLTTESAMALASIALLKLRVAENGKAQAAGNEWDAELAAAKTFADAALAAVSASHAGVGYFPTPARIGATLTRYATRKANGGNKWSAPGSYDADAFTHTDTAAAAAAIVATAAKTVAINIDLMAGVTDAEGDAVTVKSVDGKNWQLNRVINIDGVPFTMAANYHLTAAAPGKATVVTCVVVYDDGHKLTNRNLTYTSTNAAPTGNAIVTTVVNNTAINKDFKVLSTWADGNTGDLAGVKLVEFNGTPVPPAGLDKVVDGVSFHVTQAGVVTAPAQLVAHTFTGTYKIADADAGTPGVTTINWSIEVLAA